MTESVKIRVLVVDDHPVVCAGLASIINLQSDMETVAQAKNGLEAVRLFLRHVPDIALMDLRMPQMSGVEAIRKIRTHHPNSGFIVLTTYHGGEDIHRALKAGAQGYLLKGAPPEELLEAVRRVHSGRSYVPEPLKKRLAERTPESELSARELQILRLVVKGLSNKQIGQNLEITEATVKWYLNLIFARLNVTDRTQAAVAALNRGIIEV